MDKYKWWKRNEYLRLNDFKLANSFINIINVACSILSGIGIRIQNFTHFLQEKCFKLTQVRRMRVKVDNGQIISNFNVLSTFGRVLLKFYDENPRITNIVSSTNQVPLLDRPNTCDQRCMIKLSGLFPSSK